MITAFQKSAFQNDAFQIDTGLDAYLLGTYVDSHGSEFLDLFVLAALMYFGMSFF
jgi:hypothetical protein